MAKQEERTADQQWRDIIETYRRHRDLERPDFLATQQRLLEDLRREVRPLYRVALRLQAEFLIDVIGPFKPSDYSGTNIRRRLDAKGYTWQNLRYTEDALDRLTDEVAMKPAFLRRQAWWLDVAAEQVAVWIEISQTKRAELRAHASGRTPSVASDYLIGATMNHGPTEIADRLVAADVIPEREAEHDDVRAQWIGYLKKARQRYRNRAGPPE